MALPTFEYLVVAGGGGGGSGGGPYFGGAGGAGGYRAGTVALTANTTYPVVVGAGGVYTAATDTPGTKGGDSSVAGIVATGGGFGAGGTTYGGAGGSGGGGCYLANAPGAGNTPATTPAQGYDGCNYGFVGGGQRGPGGGSAGPGTGTGNGPGTVNGISGAAVTYATGGWVNAPTGFGDGGGGGRKVGDGGPAGSNGAQGIVIVRYLTQALPVATGGTVTTAGGYTIHTFTTTGQSFTVLAQGFDPTFSTLRIATTAALALQHFLTASAQISISHIDNFFAPGPLVAAPKVTLAIAARLAPTLSPLATLASLTVSTDANIPWASVLAAGAVTRWSAVGAISDTAPVGWQPYLDQSRNSLVSVLGTE